MNSTTQNARETPEHVNRLTANVGTVGGDLQTRIFSLVVLVGLSWSAIPYSGVSLPFLKVFSLFVSIIGAFLLMMGLVFSRKTHYAGLVLLIVPLIIYWAAGAGIRWMTYSVGTLSLIGVIQNIATRRCGVNRLLNINSCGG